jgi:hypothetical protein
MRTAYSGSFKLKVLTAYSSNFKGFSSRGGNSIFGSSWEKMKHGEVIKTMIEEGDFKEIEKSTGTKKWYRIKNNPYYNT